MKKGNYWSIIKIWSYYGDNYHNVSLIAYQTVITVKQGPLTFWLQQQVSKERERTTRLNISHQSNLTN